MFFNSFVVLPSIFLAASVQGVALPKRAPVTCPDGKNTASNEACCPFFALRDDLQSNIFHNECNEDAHEILRLSFHDAIVFSSALKQQGQFPGGGADGSMLIFPNDEPNFPPNAGISDSVGVLLPVLANHPDVTAGDLIQYAATVAVGNCPGGPKLEFFAGRPNATQAGPDGLIPEPQDSVDKILARFDDAAGFTPDEVVALLSSHSIARADNVDKTVPGAPFDSTPFTYDTQFFLETLLKGTGFPGAGNNTGEVQSPLPLTAGADSGEMRLQSDFAFARDSRTACTWQGFINQQQKMADAFAKAMAKLAVVGVDKSTLVDCSEVVPNPVSTQPGPATFPATKTVNDVEQACDQPFPSLASDPGASETPIPHCPPNSTDCEDDDS